MTKLSELLGGGNLTGRVQFDSLELSVVSQTISSASVTIDCVAANFHELILQTDVTSLSFSNNFTSGKAGQVHLIIRQDATGGHSVTWPASVKWSGGGTPTLTSSADAVDIFTLLTTDGGTNWVGLSVKATDQVNVPEITSPTASATNVNVNHTITGSAFSISGVTQTHTHTQYQVATDSSFSTIVYDSGEITDLVSHTIPGGSTLSFSTDHYIRIRYKGSVTGLSDWSSVVSFTTEPPFGQTLFTSSGTFTVPTGVTSVSVVCVGGGGGGGGSNFQSKGAGGGGGGALGYKNDIAVTPGANITVTVGAAGIGRIGAPGSTDGGTSSFGAHVSASGGIKGLPTGGAGGAGGTPTNHDGGGNGGHGGHSSGVGGGGGGGAGGYSGNGGNGGVGTGHIGFAGSGGAGAGGRGGENGVDPIWGQGGGGVGVLGAGSTGANAGIGGSGGSTGSAGAGGTGGDGGDYGSGGGGGDMSGVSRDGGDGGSGAVRVIWGHNRSFPSTNTVDRT